jgi:hypothetical protein
VIIYDSRHWTASLAFSWPWHDFTIGLGVINHPGDEHSLWVSLGCIHFAIGYFVKPSIQP